jgi:hypothetical protein
VKVLVEVLLLGLLFERLGLEEVGYKARPRASCEGSLGGSNRVSPCVSIWRLSTSA